MTSLVWSCVGSLVPQLLIAIEAPLSPFESSNDQLWLNFHHEMIYDIFRAMLDQWWINPYTVNPSKFHINPTETSMFSLPYVEGLLWPGRIDWPLAETLAIGSLILRFNPERHEDWAGLVVIWRTGWNICVHIYIYKWWFPKSWGCP